MTGRILDKKDLSMSKYLRWAVVWVCKFMSMSMGVWVCEYEYVDMSMQV